MRVLTSTVLLAAVGTLLVAELVPRIGGATPYTVLTGSMQPTYPPGTLIVARPVPPDEIGMGTVITYQLVSGQPTVVTHRVIAVARHPDGDLRFRTQGDANSALDEKWVRPEQVRGALWYSVPYLGIAPVGHQDDPDHGVAAGGPVLDGTGREPGDQHRGARSDSLLRRRQLRPAGR